MLISFTEQNLNYLIVDNWCFGNCSEECFCYWKYEDDLKMYCYPFCYRKFIVMEKKKLKSMFEVVIK